MLNQLLVVIAIFLNFSIHGQETKKPYFIRITMDKIRLGNDSVSFSSPKTLHIELNAKSDTIEVGAVKGTPIAMMVEIQKFFAGKTVRYRFNYSFFKKSGNKWELIKTFGWIDRFSLLNKPDEVKKSKTKKPAREEFYCSIGEPMQFSARFRMDVYLNE